MEEKMAVQCAQKVPASVFAQPNYEAYLSLKGKQQLDSQKWLIGILYRQFGKSFARKQLPLYLIRIPNFSITGISPLPGNATFQSSIKAASMLVKYSVTTSSKFKVFFNLESTVALKKSQRSFAVLVFLLLNIKKVQQRDAT